MRKQGFTKILRVRLNEADWLLVERLCEVYHVDVVSVFIRMLLRFAWDEVKREGRAGLGFTPGPGVGVPKGSGRKERGER